MDRISNSTQLTLLPPRPRNLGILLSFFHLTRVDPVMTYVCVLNTLSNLAQKPWDGELPNAESATSGTAPNIATLMWHPVNKTAVRVNHVYYTTVELLEGMRRRDWSSGRADVSLSGSPIANLVMS